MVCLGAIHCSLSSKSGKLELPESFAGWAEELGQILLPPEGGVAGAELGTDAQWCQGRLLAEGAAPGPGAEMVALEFQKALQQGRQTDALRFAPDPSGGEK